MKKTKLSLFTAALLGVTSTAVFAVPDYSSLTTAAAFPTEVLAVIAVAGALMLLYVAVKGVRVVISMIRG